MTETPNPTIADTATMIDELSSMRRCVLSVGSNLGDRHSNLQGAVDALADTPGVWPTAVSRVYESEPVNAPAGSEDFLNAVILADTTLSPRTLLERALAIEDAYGRERSSEAGAPRTLDVDLITVGDHRAQDDALVLPHPRAHQRAFVLAPWHDVEPDAELLDHGPVADLLDRVSEQSVTVRDDLTLTIQ